MSDLLLVQPRHTYAPESLGEVGNVYMPTSLLTVAARLLHAGVNIEFCDENLSQSSLNCATLGVNLLGAPYVQRARDLLARARLLREDVTLILGGQVISGFRAEELALLFGERAVNGNDDVALSNTLQLDGETLLPVNQTSLVPAYELLDDNTMQRYLGTEFSLFVSQGCKFSCTFCAAQRTRLDPRTGQYRAARETYRDIDIIERDLLYLIDRASRLGIDQLKMYLSNLDLFQSLDNLESFIHMLSHVRAIRPGCQLEMRGLSTTTSFLLAHKVQPSLIEQLAMLGLERIGFGIDGGDPAVWSATRKPHTGETCVDAIAAAHTIYDITPETLMVFGHYEIDTRESLQKAVEFTKAMWNGYGALPRPHVAKTVVPGNDGWLAASSRKIVENLLAWPPGFQTLDFTALPSPLTHPDAAFREMATDSFLEVCALEGAITRYVRPELPGMNQPELQEVRNFNEGRYDV